MSNLLKEYLDGANNPHLWSFSGPAMLRDLGLQPDPWQIQVMEGNFSRALLNCCRQSGKSTTTAALALHHALFSPHGKPTLTLLLSPSLRQSGELFRKVTGMYSKLDKPQASLKENMHELELANGSRIVSLPSAEGTIRGYSAPSLVVVDEAARVDDEIYKAVRPMLAVSNGRLLLLSTPFGKRGFFFDEWFGTGEWTRIRITAEDCPRMTDAFLADERRALGDAWFRQEYHCSFEQMAGLVYPEYEQCITDPCHLPTATRAIAGCDFGWHNPSCFLVGVMDHDDVLHIVEELYGSHMTDEELALQADKACQHWGVELAWCDSANPQSIEKLRRGGVPATEAHKAVLDGIRAVGARMRTGRLKVWRTCTNLMHELGLYHYDPDRKIAVDEPVKEWDHSCFPAGTLITTQYGPEFIEEVFVGRLVLTRQGWFPVCGWAKTSKEADIWCATFSDGRQLHGTPNHPVWVRGSGWRRLDALRYNDIVEVCNKASMAPLNALPLTEPCIGDIRLPQDESFGYIFNALVAESVCTKQSGSGLTGQSPLSIISTIKTRIRSTMSWITSNVYRAMTISLTTLASVLLRLSGPSSTLSGTWQQSGMDQKRVGRGTARTGMKLGENVEQLSANASDAVESTSQSRSMVTRDSVQEDVELTLDATQELTTRHDHALSAAQSSGAIDIKSSEPALVRVMAVCNLRIKRAVYNLAVDGPHEYYANGVLVSNCDALRYMIMGLDRGKAPIGYVMPEPKPEPKELPEIDYGPDGDYKKPVPQTRYAPAKKLSADEEWENSEEAKRLQHEHLWENGYCWETLR